jgi:hypothetical protein
MTTFYLVKWLLLSGSNRKCQAKTSQKKNANEYPLLDFPEFSVAIKSNSVALANLKQGRKMNLLGNACLWRGRLGNPRWECFREDSHWGRTTYKLIFGRVELKLRKSFSILRKIPHSGVYLRTLSTSYLLLKATKTTSGLKVTA